MLKQFTDLIVSDNIDEITLSKKRITTSYIFALYCEKGAIQFTMDGKQHQAGPGDLVLCSPRNMLGMYMRTPDLQSKIICAGEHLFDDALTGILHLDSHWWQKFIFISNNPIIHLNDFQNKLFQAYFNLMTTYLEDDDNLYRQRIIKLTAQSVAVELLHEVNGLMPEDLDSPSTKTSDNSRKDQLFRQFITSLNRLENTDREVKNYAERLKVTPKYLSAICKEKSGRTALDWITEATIRNIKFYLSQTEMTVKEITFKMNFPDVSFFCKYVKKHLGQTPLEYRYNSFTPSKS